MWSTAHKWHLCQWSLYHTAWTHSGLNADWAGKRMKYHNIPFRSVLIKVFLNFFGFKLLGKACVCFCEHTNVKKNKQEKCKQIIIQTKADTTGPFTRVDAIWRLDKYKAEVTSNQNHSAITDPGNGSWGASHLWPLNTILPALKKEWHT